MVKSPSTNGDFTINKYGFYRFTIGFTTNDSANQETKPGISPAKVDFWSTHWDLKEHLAEPIWIYLFS